MLKRIAVLGANESGLSELAAQAGASEVLLTPWTPGETPPPALSALLAPPDRFADAWPAILAAADEQCGLLGLMADAVDCREGIALGASQRVREHAIHFARVLDLSPDDRLALERGALLRDIGKIGISNEVLLKKSVLDYDEWTLIRKHPVLGGESLRERGLCPDVIEIVQYHHESYDGDGYPERLERDDIPLLARIMRILDTYCAMTSPRHYRATQATREEALDYLRSERGKHFDPDLVDAFLDAAAGQIPG
jgi:putative nucleotidyltransferase with HDIG domain